MSPANTTSAPHTAISTHRSPGVSSCASIAAAACSGRSSSDILAAASLRRSMPRAEPMAKGRARCASAGRCASAADRARRAPCRVGGTYQTWTSGLIQHTPAYNRV
jgi:hypothetical protein